VNWISYLLAIGAGAANPAQAGANAQLGKSLASPGWATVWIYLSGMAAMIVASLLTRSVFPAADKISDTPWWAWMGGFISIASTVAGLTFAQKMGSGVFTGVSVTAALAASIILDHFGWVGFKVHPASLVRVAGTALMVIGLWLVAKF
jgi:transporter family-2 protein